MPRAATRPADVAPKPATTARTAAPARRHAVAAPAAKPAPAEKIEKADKSLRAGPVDRSEKGGTPTKDIKAERVEKTDKLDKADKVVERARADKPTKPRIRMVRDSFTMPEADFALIAQLKAAAVAMGRPAKKSELLRAGLRLLAAQPPKVLLGALDGLEPVKLGRPKQGG